jgi:hypothetical protein
VYANVKFDGKEPKWQAKALMLNAGNRGESLVHTGMSVIERVPAKESSFALPYVLSKWSCRYRFGEDFFCPSPQA